MNGRDLLEGLGHVDQTLVEEAGRARPRRRRLRSWILAACVCLALVGTACAVGSLWGVQIGDLLTGEEESSYAVYGTVRTVPDKEFSKELHDSIQANWDSWRAKDGMSKILSSTLPGDGSLPFTTWAEGTEFLGIDLANPLEEGEWLEQATYVGMPLDGDHGGIAGAKHCVASWRGDEDGHVQSASLHAGYRVGEIRVMLDADVRTEYAGETAEDGSQAIETGSLWLETVNLASNSVDMADGQSAALVIAQPRREKSYVSIDAYFIQDGLLYSLNVVGPDGGDEAVAAVRAVLEQALDCFE